MIRYISSITSLILLLSGPGSLPLADEAPDSSMTLQSSNAIEIANKYTGFDKSESFDKAVIRCEKIKGPVDDKTPFLYEKIADQTLWKIIYPGIKVGRGNRFIERDFEVFLDSATGKLLRIYSVSDEVGSSDTLPEPNPRTTGEYWTNVAFMRIPDSIPATSFLKALEALTDNPARVKVIRAMYFDYKVCHPVDTTNCAYRRNNWIIITRGSETIIPMCGEPTTPVPDALLNSLWNLVDGKTGRWILSTNAPQDPGILQDKDE